MEKNKVVICSNPYKKQIDYLWYNEGKWKNVREVETTSLNSERFFSQSISHIAYNMFQKIKEDLGNSIGEIEVIFQGTDDEFADLTFIKDNYYSDCGIELKRDSKKMKPANEVIRHIEISYTNLREYFEEYPDEETQKVISKYSETVKQEIALCVMGVYSAGKSSFINSIIGQEILPSANKATTAKIYKIQNSEQCKIRFVFEGIDDGIIFEGTTWKSIGNPQSEIVKLFRDIIDKKKPQFTAQYMYCALDALNKFANEENNKLGDIIEVYTNFVQSHLPLEQFKFVIYDTPGTGSATFQKHTKVLAKSLEQQTNGLPIFITDPENTDKNDTKDAKKIIDEFGAALDLPNMLLVVNKADRMEEEGLREIVENKDNSIVTKWKAEGVYLVSSIIGLGGKKENPEDKANWMNRNNWGNFLDGRGPFGDPNNERYKRLFDYNILSKDAKERISKRVENIEEKELLLWNSGIPCVEEAIGAFAQKYALYNKCVNAIGYLTEAAGMVKESVSKAERKAEELRNKIEKNLDEKKKELSEKLKFTCNAKCGEYIKRFADEVMYPATQNYIDKKRIEGVVLAVLKNSPGRNDYAKLEPFNKGIESSLSADIKQYSRETSNKKEKYWEECAEDLKSSLLKKVVESPNLSNAEKEILKKEIFKIEKVPDIHENVNIINTRAIANKGKKILFFWDRTRIIPKKAVDVYEESLGRDISKITLQAESDNEKSFKLWGSQLLKKLDTVIASFNPELIKLNRDLEEKGKIIKSKKREEEFITKKIEKIDQLLKLEEE